MSEYPIPTKTNLFNEVDYEQLFPVNHNNNQAEPTDVSNLVKKDGDVMTGFLKLPGVRFDNNSLQTVAYDPSVYDSYKLNTTNNTFKLTNVTRVSNFTTISDLKVDNIQFGNFQQTQAFLNLDKSTIYANANKLQNISHEPNKIIANAPIWFGGNSYITATQNSLAIMSESNGGIVLNPGSNRLINLYSSAVRIGRVTGRIEMNNEAQHFCFTNERKVAVEANQTQIANINTKLNNAFTFNNNQTTSNQSFRVTTLLINDEEQHSFTLTDFTKLNENTTDVTDINTNLSNAFTFDTNETTSNQSLKVPSLKINNVDQHSFTLTDFTKLNENTEDIIQNATDISNLETKTTGVSYLNGILNLSSDLTTSNNSIRMDSYGIEFNRNGVYMGKFGPVGDAPVFDVISNNLNINFQPGIGKVIMTTGELKIGNGSGTSQIVLNNGIQNFAYTNADKNGLSIMWNNLFNGFIFGTGSTGVTFSRKPLKINKLEFDDGEQNFAFTNTLRDNVINNTSNIATIQGNINLRPRFLLTYGYPSSVFLNLTLSPNVVAGSTTYFFDDLIGKRLHTTPELGHCFSSDGEIIDDYGILNFSYDITYANTNTPTPNNASIHRLQSHIVFKDQFNNVFHSTPLCGHNTLTNSTQVFSNYNINTNQYLQWLNQYNLRFLAIRTYVHMLPRSGPSSLVIQIQIKN